MLDFLKRLLGIDDRKNPKIDMACNFFLFYDKLREYCEENDLDTDEELKKIMDNFKE